ncbi:MAG: PEP/pyruvate-binding domain-containing protein [Pseudomonadales bacterium]
MSNSASTNNTPTAGSYLLALKDAAGEAVGGKAHGLAQLINMGLRVPDGFVIVNAQIDALPQELEQRYASITGPVAVRSSALAEDGDSESFAGQFDSYLNVDSFSALNDAIKNCIASLNTSRAQAYQQRSGEQETTMNIVVQSMVDARAAGVVFTADPVSGRHNRLVVDSVMGLGEALVSGEATPDHFVLAPNDEVLERSLVADDASITDSELLRIAQDARTAAASTGNPLDLEWAIDHNGDLYWLQARPITTLGVDLNDGCTPIPADQVITRCNVGEMMPGPVCPLTFSVQGRAIEHGMQYMHTQYARRPAITDEWTQINLFYGHMFINLSGSLDAGRNVSFNTAENTAAGVCGRAIPELKNPENRRLLPFRWLGSLRFFRFCMRAAKFTAEFESRFRHFHIAYTDHSESMIMEMETKFPWLCEMNEVHLRTSAYSGVMEAVIQSIVTGKSKDTDPEKMAELQAEAARLLAGASDVESAVMVEQLDGILDLLAEDQTAAQNFSDASSAMALAWLNKPQSAAVGLRFREFMQRHGHRGYRELCVRSPAWVDEPERLVESMQASIASRMSGVYKPKNLDAVDLDSLPAILRYLLPKAHDAIRLREQTKSALVLCTHTLQSGYRHLGELLQQENKLPDADLVFFMSREELSSFCRDGDEEMIALCEKRRTALEFQDLLEFDDVHVGPAEPRDHDPIVTTEHGELIGRPVSRGVVEGRARVATTLAEAAKLRHGEILVSKITDIGWTPYFSLIAGLATDVGSAVSHGAVIAREYGLPAIVNLQVATKIVKTGDLIQLDADRGILKILDDQDSKSHD